MLKDEDDFKYFKLEEKEENSPYLRVWIDNFS